MKPVIKSDKNHCHGCVLLYSDDTLVVSENAESILRNKIGKHFELNEESVGLPKTCLVTLLGN